MKAKQKVLFASYCVKCELLHSKIYLMFYLNVILSYKLQTSLIILNFEIFQYFTMVYRITARTLPINVIGTFWKASVYQLYSAFRAVGDTEVTRDRLC